MSNHLICWSGTVKMLPDRSLIWSLIGFCQVKNMGLVVFYLTFNSHLWHFKSVRYSSLKVWEKWEQSIASHYIPPCKDDMQDCLHDMGWQRGQYRQHCSPKNSGQDFQKKFMTSTPHSSLRRRVGTHRCECDHRIGQWLCWSILRWWHWSWNSTPAHSLHGREGCDPRCEPGGDPRVNWFKCYTEREAMQLSSMYQCALVLSVWCYKDRSAVPRAIVAVQEALVADQKANDYSIV